MTRTMLISTVLLYSASISRSQTVVVQESFSEADWYFAAQAAELPYTSEPAVVGTLDALSVHFGDTSTSRSTINLNFPAIALEIGDTIRLEFDITLNSVSVNQNSGLRLGLYSSNGETQFTIDQATFDPFDLAYSGIGAGFRTGTAGTGSLFANLFTVETGTQELIFNTDDGQWSSSAGDKPGLIDGTPYTITLSLTRTDAGCHAVSTLNGEPYHSFSFSQNSTLDFDDFNQFSIGFNNSAMNADAGFTIENLKITTIPSAAGSGSILFTFDDDAQYDATLDNLTGITVSDIEYIQGTEKSNTSQESTVARESDWGSLDRFFAVGSGDMESDPGAENWSAGGTQSHFRFTLTPDANVALDLRAATWGIKQIAINDTMQDSSDDNASYTVWNSILYSTDGGSTWVNPNESSYETNTGTEANSASGTVEGILYKRIVGSPDTELGNYGLIPNATYWTQTQQGKDLDYLMLAPGQSIEFAVLIFDSQNFGSRFWAGIDDISIQGIQAVKLGPDILEFAATPNVAEEPGDPLQLIWDVANATEVVIEPGIGSVSNTGSTVINPASNTIYTLTASRIENGETYSVSSTLYTYIREQMPPNILFIAIDDLKRIGGYFADDPGNLLPRIYPDPAIREQVISHLTPNIDQLAATGVSFKRAYCASPSCNPSRAALLTGVRPHISGLVDLKGGIFFRDWEFNGERPLANSITLPRHLSNNGYYSVGTGKVFHLEGYDENDGDESWDDFIRLTGSAGNQVFASYSNRDLSERWGQEGPDDASHTAMKDYIRADFMATLMETGSSATLDLPEGTPFFIACGIQKPHLPFMATKDLIDLFPTNQMTGINAALRDEFLQDCDDLPPTSLEWSGAALSNGDPVLDSDRFVDILNYGNALTPDGGDIAAWRQMVQHYLACSALADRCVGRLLEGLANSPYADNTIVILWSDHGYHLGEKMHFSKFALWEDSAGVPFIIRDPKQPSGHGIPCQRPVNLIDIYPTLCSRIGLPLPDPRITGHDLNPLLADPRAPWNIPSLCTHNHTNTHALVTDRFKLITHQGSRTDAELYDRDADPNEYTNLINHAAFEDPKDELFNLLHIAEEEGVFPKEQEWTLENWRHAYWNRSANTGSSANNADPDDDGWDNVTEFALLGDPLEPSPELAQAITFSIEENEGRLRFPFRDAPSSIAYRVYQTTNLLDEWSVFWDSAIDPLDTATESDHGNGTRAMRVALPVDLPSRFMKLEIVEP